MTRTVALFALFLAPTAFAQEVEVETSTSKVKYKDRTEIDFDALALSATLAKPSGQVVISPPQGVFNPMIHLRTDFTVEMKQSVDAVK